MRSGRNLQPATSSINISVHLRVPVADTVLDCRDRGGGGHPIIFLNGAFGTQHDWKKVIHRLGNAYRVITYDERARGKSRKSRDYSFDGCLADLAAIIAATRVTRPLLLGWSMGAAIAVRYAAANPSCVAGLVLIDGAFPIPPLTEVDKENARRTFRKTAPLLRILRIFGKAARMSANEAANVNIELREICGKIQVSYNRITGPIFFVLAGKRSRGETEERFRAVRASIGPLVERHKNISIFRTLPCTHLELLSKHPDTIVSTIADVSQRFAS